jgi:hypothetical protein
MMVLLLVHDISPPRCGAGLGEGGELAGWDYATGAEFCKFGEEVAEFLVKDVEGWSTIAEWWREEMRRDRGKSILTFNEQVKNWKDLLDAERLRSTIAAARPDEKWSANFSTSKEEMLKWVDERIDALRKQLGLSPSYFR